MLFAQLTTEDKTQLRNELKCATNAKWFRRLTVIELSSRGFKVSALAHMFSLSEATIRIYIHAFNRDKLDGLRPTAGSGRPHQIEWEKAKWEDLLYQSSSDFDKLGSQAKNWSQKLLVQYLATYHQISVSQSTISKVLRKVGIRWRRAKLKVHSPDPLYQVKRERIDHLRNKALCNQLSSADAEGPPPEEKPAHFVYFDATDLHWCPDLGNGYRAAGQQTKVDSPGSDNPWYALLGSLHYPSGEGFYTIHDRKRSAEAVAHFQLLIDCDPDVFWFVVIDNASAHHTQQMKAFAQEYQQRIEFVFLPTYSPHLNLIERLWGYMRNQMTRNFFYDSLEHMAKAVVAWLGCLPFSTFCSLMGVNPSQLSFLQEHFE